MKKIYIVALILLTAVSISRAQSQYQPYSYQFYQKFNAQAYSTKTRLHTSLKPFLVDDTVLQQRYNELITYGLDSTRTHTWIHRKIFNEHLFEVNDKEYTFFADYLTDITAGRDGSGKKNIWRNTRGFQLGGTIGTKFYFYSAGFENQAVFPQYYTNYINQVGVIPGQAFDRTFAEHDEKDWSNAIAVASYTPIKFLNITLGQDRNFIGDGYRSQLLSDFASPYPFLKLTANIGNVKYMTMWSYMTDPASPQVSYINGYRKKWGAFHYLDWNVNNKLSLGFFEAVIWAERDGDGNFRGFDFNYLNPIVFLRPTEASIGSPDNAMLGLTGKYKIADGMAVYGQFALDEFEAKSFFGGKGSSRNKYAYQIGIRGADLFKVKNLNYLLEYNTALPYTYSEQNSITNYSQQAEPLAHPFGANYRETVGMLNYSYKRFDFSGQLNYAHYGLDTDATNYGKDIFKSYLYPAKLEGNYVGQGLTTNMVFLQGKVAYVVNPKYNLRVELGATFRQENNSKFNDKTTMVFLALRSSFRHLYEDIATYRAY